jgi:predicted metalloprotease
MRRLHCSAGFIKACATITAALLFGSVSAQERSSPSPEASPGSGATPESSPLRERTRDFIRAVLGDTEDVWDELFREMAHGIYPKPAVVLVSRWASSECGNVDVALAPFYCARDGRIYVDPKLLEALANRSGDFAAAYVSAREVGRHVQAVLRTAQRSDKGTAPTMQQQSAGMPAAVEVQADCYAGVWTHFVRKRNIVDSRELEDGSAAAVTVGNVSNDRDSAARRLRAFKHGLGTGDPRSCGLAELPG